MSEPSLTVAIAQDVFLPGEVEANLVTIRRHIEQANEAGADVVVLPELATSGYFTLPAVADAAEPIDGPTIASVRSMAREAGVAVCVGYPESGGENDPDGAIFNSVVLIGSDGTVLANHRKTHLWADETKRFTAADDPMTIVDFMGFKLAILICYEVEFPELVRQVAVAGVDLVLVPTALADFGTSAVFTQQIIGARATENNVFIAYANHAGLIDGDKSLGSSVIVAPLCRLVASADADPSFHVATLDRAELVAARGRLPYLRDRRPELYSR